MITIVRRAGFAALAASALAAPTFAQGSRRPAPAAPQAFRFPTVLTRTLPNGLRVHIVEDHSAQVVAVRAVFGIDETFDPAGKEGLYQVMLGALREGTTTKTAAQLGDASARIGTAVAPTAFSTVPAAFDAALTLMGDMLMHPSFAPATIERRKAVQGSSFRSIAARASTPARTLFYAMLDGRDDAVTRGQYATDAPKPQNPMMLYDWIRLVYLEINRFYQISLII